MILSADLFMLGASRLGQSSMVLPVGLFLCTPVHGIGFLQTFVGIDGEDRFQCQ